MIVVVGSENEVKVRAVRDAFAAAFGEEPSVIAISVDSGVPPQPFNEDLFIGARNRALNAMKALPGKDFYVGVEGGALDAFGQRLIATAVCVADRKGELSCGMTGGFPVPERVWGRLLAGEELGDVMDSMFNVKGTKRGAGAIGILTKGLIDRKSYIEHGVIMALVRFMSPEAWEAL